MSGDVIDLHDRDAQIFEAWVQGDRVADIARQFQCHSDSVLKARNSSPCSGWVLGVPRLTRRTWRTAGRAVKSI
jgi:hypothetical protein